jgi:hypothetical protein
VGLVCWVSVSGGRAKQQQQRLWLAAEDMSLQLLQPSVAVVCMASGSERGIGCIGLVVGTVSVLLCDQYHLAGQRHARCSHAVYDACSGSPLQCSPAALDLQHAVPCGACWSTGHRQHQFGTASLIGTCTCWALVPVGYMPSCVNTASADP